MMLTANRRDVFRAGVLNVAAALLIFLSGCATPVGVRRLDQEEARRQLTANVLSGDTLSASTRQILNRSGMDERFQSVPEEVIAAIHKGLPTANEQDRLFALAELSFMHASESGSKSYFLSAAIYAYAFLFPRDPALTPDPFDPRFRLAADLYNQGIVNGFKERKGNVVIKNGSYKVPFGEAVITVDSNEFLWGEFRLVNFVDASELSVRGLKNQYRWHGIGAPLIASLEPLPGIKNMAYAKVPPALKVPVTAILRISNLEEGLKTGLVKGKLEFNTSEDPPYTILEGRTVPVEYGFSTALSYTLEGSKIYDLELKGLLSGDRQLSRYQDRFPDNIFLMTPYQKGRIPVVLVHGTVSSPARWSELINELLNDRDLRGKYQLWLFTYNTGNPILYTAGIFVEGLKHTVMELDPEGNDAAMKKMVIIGHSQGGLLAKLTAVDSGARFWENATTTPFDEFDLSPETKKFLKQSFFYKPLPFVKRVVFIATPQNGSFVAGNWIGQLGGNLITVPRKILNPLNELKTRDSKKDVRFTSRNIPRSTDNMAPGSPFIKAISSLPVAPGIYAHSIIAVSNPDSPKEKWKDGVVAYESAHIEGVKSELVVHSDHSAQYAPEAIEEVRRILVENLKEP